MKGIKKLLPITALSLICLLTAIFSVTGAWYKDQASISATVTVGQPVTIVVPALTDNDAIYPGDTINFENLYATADDNTTDMYIRAYVEVIDEEGTAYNSDSYALKVNSTEGNGWVQYSEDSHYFYYVGANTVNDVVTNKVSAVNTSTLMSSLQPMKAGESTLNLQISATMDESIVQGDSANETTAVPNSQVLCMIVFQAIQVANTGLEADGSSTETLVKDLHNSWGGATLRAQLSVDGKLHTFNCDDDWTVGDLVNFYNESKGGNLSESTTCGFYANKALTESVELTDELISGKTYFTQTATTDATQLSFTIPSTYSSSSETYAYVSAGTNPSGKIVIPKKYQNYSVVIAPATQSSEGAFYNCTNITSINASGVAAVSAYAFSGCSNLTSVIYSDNISAELTTDISGLYQNCTSLEDFNFANLNTANVTKMDYMLQGLSGIETLDLSELNMNSVTSCQNMLDGLTSLKEIISPVSNNTSITLPTDKNFYDNSVEVSARTAVSAIPANITTAKTYVIGFTLTVNANGGLIENANSFTVSADSKTASIVKLYNETVNQIPTFSQRTGYTYVEMNTNEDGTGTRFTAGNYLTENLEIFAIWQAKTFKITLSSTGATSAGTTEVYFAFGTETYYSDANLTNQITSIITPSKSNNNFQGYFTAENGVGTKYIDSTGAFVNSLCNSISEDATLYAFFKAKTIAITLSSTGATTAGTTAIYFAYGTETYYSNAELTSQITTITTPTKSYNRFKGYYTSENGVGTQYINEYGDFVNNLYSAVTDNTTLYAYFETIKIVLTLDNTSALTTGTETVAYIYGTETYYSDAELTSQITSITVPTKTGYTFKGYFTGTAGSGTKYIDSTGAFVNNPYTAISADTTLYAYWTGVVVKITLEKNGGTSSSSYIYYRYGTNTYYRTYTSSTDTLSSSTTTIYATTKTGHTFGGYYSEDNGGGTQYINTSRSFTNNLCTAFAEDTTLYAKWTVNTYTVTLSNDGGSGGTSKIYYQYGINSYYSNPGLTSKITSVSKPTKAGYIFQGYYLDGVYQYIIYNGTFSSYNLLYEYAPTSTNITLVAEWKPTTVTITLDSNGADLDSGTSNIYYKFETSTYFSDYSCTNQISQITVPQKAGSTFLGYFTSFTDENTHGSQYVSADGIIESGLAMAFYQNVILYAGWTEAPQVVTVTLDATNSMYPDFPPTSTGTTTFYYLYNTNEYFSDYALSTPITSITVPTISDVFRFAGYFTSEYDENMNYVGATQYISSTGAIINSLYSAASSNITLYAKYEFAVAVMNSGLANVFADPANYEYYGYIPHKTLTFTRDSSLIQNATFIACVSEEAYQNNTTSTPGKINMYESGDNLYVYCDEEIYFYGKFYSYSGFQSNTLETINFNNVNTVLMTDFSEMFNNCRALTSLDMSSFDASNVKDISRMFSAGIDGGTSPLKEIKMFDFNPENLTGTSDGMTTSSGYDELFGGMASDCYVYVKTQEVKDWILSLEQGTYWPTSWTEENIIVDGEQVEYTFNVCVDGVTTSYTTSAIENSSAERVIKSATGLTTENTCGFYSDANLTTSLTSSNRIENGATYYTKMATITAGDGTTILNLDEWQRTDSVHGGYETYAVTVTVNSEANVSEIVIPKTYNGYPITIGGSYTSEWDTTSVYTRSFGNITNTQYKVWANGVSKVQNNAFDGASNLTNIVFSDNLDTSEVTNMSYMFNNCQSLKMVEFNNFNTANVEDMSYMFNMCSALSSLDLSSFNTTNVSYFNNMFAGCTNISTLLINSFDEKITNLSSDAYRYMFQSMVKDEYSTPTNRVYVKTQTIKDWILNTLSGGQDRPSMWTTDNIIVSEGTPTGFYLNLNGNTVKYYATSTNALEALEDAYASNMEWYEEGSWKTQTTGFYTNEKFSTIVKSTDTIVPNATYYAIGEVEGSMSTIGQYYKMYLTDNSGYTDSVTNEWIEFEYLMPNGIFQGTSVSSAFNNSEITDVFMPLYGQVYMSTSIKETAIITYNNLESGGIRNLTADSDTNRTVRLIASGVKKINTHAFYNSTGFNEILFSDNLDISDITDLSYVFYGTSNITSLDVSMFNHPDNANFNYAFGNMSSLQTLTLGDFNTNITHEGIFSGVSDTCTVYVKTAEIESWILALSSTDRPAAWTDDNIIYDNENEIENPTNPDDGEGEGGEGEGGESSTAINFKVSIDGVKVPYSVSSSTSAYTSLVEVTGLNDETTCGFYTDKDMKIAVKSTDKLVEGATYYTLVATNEKLSFFQEGSAYVAVSAASTDISGTVVIPKQYNGIPVRMTPGYYSGGFNGAFANCSQVSAIYANGLQTVNSFAFAGCTSLTNVYFSDNLDTSTVTSMEGMFYGTAISSIDVSMFDVSNVTNFNSMFSSCASLSSLNLTSWEVSTTSNISVSCMFEMCSNLFSLYLFNFNTGMVSDCSMMFYSMFDWSYVYVTTAGIQSWILNNTDTNFRPSNWTTDYVVVLNTQGTFAINYNGESKYINYNEFQGQTVYSVFSSLMGADVDATTCGLYFDANLSQAVSETEVVQSGATYYSYRAMLTGYTSASPDPIDLLQFEKTTDGTAYKVSLTEAGKTFDSFASTEKPLVLPKKYNGLPLIIEFDSSTYTGGLSGSNAYWIIASGVSSIGAGDFYNCTNLQKLWLSDNLDTSAVTNMDSMFCGCSNLTDLDVSFINTSSLQSASKMFAQTSLRSLDVSHFDATNLTNMSGMFGRIENLNSLILFDFNPANITEYTYIFNGLNSGCMVFVPTEEIQTWILNLSTGSEGNRPAEWNTENVKALS